jgi:hypothetical protein
MAKVIVVIEDVGGGGEVQAFFSPERAEIEKRVRGGHGSSAYGYALGVAQAIMQMSAESAARKQAEEVVEPAADEGPVPAVDWDERVYDFCRDQMDEFNRSVGRAIEQAFSSRDESALTARVVLCADGRMIAKTASGSPMIEYRPPTVDIGDDGGIRCSWWLKPCKSH